MALNINMYLIPKDGKMAEKVSEKGKENNTESGDTVIFMSYKCSFLYSYFEERMENGCAWAEKDDMGEIMDRCSQILAHDFNEEGFAEFASSLLPNHQGNHWGSMRYDKVYYNRISEVYQKLYQIQSIIDWDNDRVMVRATW